MLRIRLHDHRRVRRPQGGELHVRSYIAWYLHGNSVLLRVLVAVDQRRKLILLSQMLEVQ